MDVHAIINDTAGVVVISGAAIGVIGKMLGWWDRHLEQEIKDKVEQIVDELTSSNDADGQRLKDQVNSLTKLNDWQAKVLNSQDAVLKTHGDKLTAIENRIDNEIRQERDVTKRLVELVRGSQETTKRASAVAEQAQAVAEQAIAKTPPTGSQK